MENSHGHNIREIVTQTITPLDLQCQACFSHELRALLNPEFQKLRSTGMEKDDHHTTDSKDRGGSSQDWPLEKMYTLVTPTTLSGATCNFYNAPHRMLSIQLHCTEVVWKCQLGLGLFQSQTGSPHTVGRVLPRKTLDQAKLTQYIQHEIEHLAQDRNADCTWSQHHVPSALGERSGNCTHRVDEEGVREARGHILGRRWRPRPQQSPGHEAVSGHRELLGLGAGSNGRAREAAVAA